MNIIGIIPARYHSSRLPGKPLMDIGGHPMVWWVYQHARQATGFSDLLVATDDIRIQTVCTNLNIRAMMTSPAHSTHIARIHEVSKKLPADRYVSICGDEPMLGAPVIQQFLTQLPIATEPCVQILARPLTDLHEKQNPSKIKLYFDHSGRCLLLTRAPAPFDYRKIEGFQGLKLVGLEGYNLAALQAFHESSPGLWEQTEDIALLRFIEQHIKICGVTVPDYQISVDTQEDLDHVRKIMLME